MIEEEPKNFVSTSIEEISNKLTDAGVLVPNSPSEKLLLALGSGKLRFVRAADAPLIDISLQKNQAFLK